MSDMNDSRPARWDYERSKGRQLERLRRKSKRSTPSSRNRFERAKRRQREIWRADTRIANEAKYLRSGAVDLNDGIDELVGFVVDARRKKMPQAEYDRMVREEYRKRRRAKNDREKDRTRRGSVPLSRSERSRLFGGSF